MSNSEDFKNAAVFLKRCFFYLLCFIGMPAFAAALIASKARERITYPEEVTTYAKRVHWVYLIISLIFAYNAIQGFLQNNLFFTVMYSVYAIGLLLYTKSVWVRSNSSSYTLEDLKQSNEPEYEVGNFLNRFCQQKLNPFFKPPVELVTDLTMEDGSVVSVASSLSDPESYHAIRSVSHPAP